MNAPHRLQGFPPISPAAIGRAFADGRAYRDLEAHCRAAKPLHRARHYRIGGTFFDALCIYMAVFAASFFIAALVSAAGRL